MPFFGSFCSMHLGGFFSALCVCTGNDAVLFICLFIFYLKAMQLCEAQCTKICHTTARSASGKYEPELVFVAAEFSEVASLGTSFNSFSGFNVCGRCLESVLAIHCAPVTRSAVPALENMHSQHSQGIFLQF